MRGKQNQVSIFVYLPMLSQGSLMLWLVGALWGAVTHDKSGL